MGPFATKQPGRKRKAQVNTRARGHGKGKGSELLGEGLGRHKGKVVPNHMNTALSINRSGTAEGEVDRR